MINYWKAFWTRHAQATIDAHPQRQVLRTHHKEPISEELFDILLKDIVEKLDLRSDDVVLDLCCGNGLITQHIAPLCTSVIAVDFVQELVDQIDRKKHPNIYVFAQDIRRLRFGTSVFDKVMIYSGIQYLSLKETHSLFEAVMRWLRGDGLFFVGDIPDQDKLLRFFGAWEAGSGSVTREPPIIGTWFSAEWLEKLGRAVGFKRILILPQPKGTLNAHYRFDMIMRKG